MNFKDWKLSFFLFWKSIQRGNISSLILVIGIMMVVFLNLLFTDAIFAGITEGINQGKIDYQFGEVIVKPEINKDYINDSKEIVNNFKDNSFVKKASEILEFGVAFVNQKRKDGRDEERISNYLMGIDLKNNSNDYVFDIKSKIIAGRMLKEGDVGKIIIGSELAGGYGVSVFPDDLGGVKVGGKILVERGKFSKEFEVVGIFKSKNFNLDIRAFVPEKELRKMVGLYSGADQVIFRLNDKKDSKKFMEILKKNGLEKKEIADWEEKLLLGSAINKSFEMIGTILRFIGSLVAGLVIFIIIFVDIVNKRRQIGIMKAIGIKESVIINSYILLGGFYALIGVLFGFVLMKYVIIEAFKIKPIDMPMADVVPLLKTYSLYISTIFFLFAGFFGSSIPAFKEIKKKILDLLYK